MNMLFGLLVALLYAGGCLAVTGILLGFFGSAIPAKFKRWVKPTAIALSLVILVSVFTNVIGTYGPRQKLPDSSQTVVVERLEVETGKSWSDSERDRTGEVDAQLSKRPDEMPGDQEDKP